MGGIIPLIPENHISFASANDLTVICAPLFRHTDIDFLWYARYYTDDSVMLLNSNLAFHKYHLNEIADKIWTWSILDMLANKKPRYITSGYSATMLVS
jgi:hypothetical protein